MKNIFRRLMAFILILFILSGLGNAFAVHSGYDDIRGHWAENTMLRALNDALLEDTGSRLKPDEPMTGTEILTVLGKVLSAESQAAAPVLPAPPGSRPVPDKLVTRGRAFSLLAEAFQLIGAETDASVLSEYTDGNTLSGAFRPAAAALVSSGFVGGVDGALLLNNNISRAEFLTVLYRILPEYKEAAVNQPVISGGIILPGDSVISNRQFSGNVYFDRSSTNIRLQNVIAPTVVLRSDHLRTLSVSGCKIDRLVFAAASGDVFFNPGFMSDIKTAVIGTGGGKITLGAIPNIEVTGSNREVFITGPVKSLLVSGSGNKISVMPGVTIDSVKVLTAGAGNTVSVNGLVSACLLFGRDTAVGGTGTVYQLLDNAKNSSITAYTVNTAVNTGYGLNAVEMTLEAPDNFSAYETLKASVTVSADDVGRRCRAAWYFDDVLISHSEVDIGVTDMIALNSDIKNTGNMPVTSTLSFILSYVIDSGYYQEIRADKSITLDAPAEVGAAEALALVKTGYQGDYTLDWAKANDYHETVKTAWVNAKNYSSKTDYLVWVNIAHQRVNVFTGSAGDWSLKKSFIVGSGAPGHDTPTGVFRILGRNARGWNAKTYTVKPVIFFKNSAYGFHSRLYDPGTTNISDARIGFPVSQGCIRMYDEDVAWFYDYIPINTTVVVY